MELQKFQTLIKFKQKNGQESTKKLPSLKIIAKQRRIYPKVLYLACWAILWLQLGVLCYNFELPNLVQTLCLLLTLLLHNNYASYIAYEHLIITQNYGIHMQKTYMNWSSSRRMMHMCKFKDIAIHEAMTPCHAYHYICILEWGDSQLTLPFNDFKPRLKELRTILNHSLKLLA